MDATSRKFLKTWTRLYLPCKEVLFSRPGPYSIFHAKSCLSQNLNHTVSSMHRAAFKQKEQDFAMHFAGQGESAPTLILGTFYPFEGGLFSGYFKPKRCESNTSYKPTLISSFVYIIYIEDPTTLPPLPRLSPGCFTDL
jgi:hypothetical protein